MTLLMYSEYHELYKTNVVRHNKTYSTVNMPKEQVANERSTNTHPHLNSYPVSYE